MNTHIGEVTNKKNARIVQHTWKGYGSTLFELQYWHEKDQKYYTVQTAPTEMDIREFAGLYFYHVIEPIVKSHHTN